MLCARFCLSIAINSRPQITNEMKTESERTNERQHTNTHIEKHERTQETLSQAQTYSIHYDE